MKKKYRIERTLTLTVQELYWAVASRYDQAMDATVCSVEMLPDGTIQIKTFEEGDVEL